METLERGDALLVIDIQEDFCAGGALEVPGGDDVVPTMNRWIRQARDANIPVFYARDWHPANHVSFKEQGGPWPPHCVQNTPGARFHSQLDVPAGATIVSKDDPLDDAYSAFRGTDLRDRLSAAGVDRVWIGGLALDYCVAATALDARSEGLQVELLLNATRAVNVQPGDGDRAMKQMETAGIHIRRDG